LILGSAGILVVVLMRAPANSKPPSIREEMEADQQEGERAWQQGDYPLAAQKLRAARELREKLGDPTASETARGWEQMERQADLVANWLGKPLPKLLEEWQTNSDEDWHKLFAQRQGKSVVFDTLISRNAAGSWHCERLFGPPLPRLELSNLTGLRSLPIREQQRVIFGARLAGLQRERGRPIGDPERWTADFEPQSFVLITDAKIAEALLLIIDDEMPKVLARQAGWVMDRP
jgi:hypothetical protein